MSDFEWILEGSRAILSTFQYASACEGCPRAGRVEGWASQRALQVLEYLLVWFAPCKYGVNIWHLFIEPYPKPLENLINYALSTFQTDQIPTGMWD